MRKTSLTKFVDAAEVAGFKVTAKKGTYKKSLGTTGRYDRPALRVALDAAGWDRSKKECTSSYSNWKGETFWMETPCVVLTATKTTTDYVVAEVSVVAKFDGGKFVEGYDSRFTGSFLPLKDLLEAMAENSGEKLAARAEKRALALDVRRKADRCRCAARFREVRAENRQVDTQLLAYGLSPSVVLDLRNDGMLAGHKRADLVYLAKLWAKTSLHRELV